MVNRKIHRLFNRESLSDGIEQLGASSRMSSAVVAPEKAGHEPAVVPHGVNENESAAGHPRHLADRPRPHRVVEMMGHVDTKGEVKGSIAKRQSCGVGIQDPGAAVALSQLKERDQIGVGM